MQLTQTTLTTGLSDLVATGNAFDPAATFLGVATALTNNGLNTTMSNVTPATGAMSARTKMSPWTGPYLTIAGQAYLIGPEAVFSPASSAEAQTLAAWFLSSASVAGNLLGFGVINPPVNLPNSTRQWGIVMRLSLDSNGVWDVSVAFNG